MNEISTNSDIVVDNEVDLRQLLSVLWDGKIIISLITSIVSIVSVLVALSLPNIYTASALLAPAESSGGGLPNLVKQYGSLASLAGVSLPGGDGASRTQLGIEIMRSRAFIREFVDQHSILPELMAVDSWDSSSDSIVFDNGLYDPSEKVWLQPKPSGQQAFSAFSSILGISEDKMTGYVSVSIEHQSPTIAAQWVSWLIEGVNYTVKRQDVDEATKSIEYLKQQAASTALADLQAMFFELIQTQTETVMLAEVRPEYVFKTIDPAEAPEIRSKPNRALICLFGGILGGMLGVIMVLIRYYSRKNLWK